MRRFIYFFLALIGFNLAFSQESQELNLMNGTWDFYWQELISLPNQSESRPISVEVPSDWQEYDVDGIDQFGYATYIKVIEINNDGNMGIRIDHVFSAYEIFVNGRSLHASGKVGKSREEYMPYREPRNIRIPLDLGDKLTIAMQSSNFDHLNSGFYYEIILDDFESLSNDLNAKQGVSLFLAGGFFITGFILFGFSVVSRQLELQVFFYALFSLSLMYRMLGSSPYPLHALIEGYDFYLATKLEYLTIHTAALFGGLFIFETFKAQANIWLTRIFYCGVSISTLIVLFSGPAVFTSTLKYFLFFVLFYVLVFVYTIVRAKIQKAPSSNYLIAALICLFVWTLFQVVTFLNLGVIPFWVNVILVSLLIVLCNVALFSTFIMRVALVKDQEGQLILAESKNTMLSLISHEIKVPVASLQMNLAMLKEAINNEELLNRIKHKTIHGAHESVESIKLMINDFLFFMSYEQEKSTERINLTAVENVIKTEFETSLIVHDSKAFTFESHLITLSYIIRTLVNNAHKHTDQEAKEPEIHISHDNLELVIEVRDFSHGISDETLASIGKTRKRVSPSLEVEGMGFFLAKELATKLNHIIKIEQNTFGGTSAFVIIRNG